MKFRSDFVTNSSSSSFILAFQSEKEYSDFVNKCHECDYVEFYELIDRLAQSEAGHSLHEALRLLDGYYWHEVANVSEILDSIIKRSDYKNSTDYYIARSDLQDSPAVRAMVEERLKSSDYAEVRKAIEDATLVVTGTIWDSCGGLLNWAIRNDFIKNEFWDVCKLSWNIG